MKIYKVNILVVMVLSLAVHFACADKTNKVIEQLESSKGHLETSGELLEGKELAKSPIAQSPIQNSTLVDSNEKVVFNEYEESKGDEIIPEEVTSNPVKIVEVQKDEHVVDGAEISEVSDKNLSDKSSQDPVEEEKQGEVIDEPETIEREVKERESTQFSHDIWDGLLKTYVTNAGKVNYAGLKTKMGDLETYLISLTENAPASNWSANKTKAYWINAYNAFTIKLILDNYPIGSIMELHGGKPWDHSWIQIGGKTYSLNDIEHKILRPMYNDARIHFAVNCAAKSCPKVLNKAWTESNIESTLDKMTKAFLQNQKMNSITKNSIKLSKIFEWYQSDFGDLINFINRYSDVQVSKDAKIEFNEYDWNLNS